MFEPLLCEHHNLQFQTHAVQHCCIAQDKQKLQLFLQRQRWMLMRPALSA